MKPSKKTVELVVYIGRLSPFHLGHATVITNMLRNYDYSLIILGSSFQPRTIKNPWTFAERKSLITEWLNSTEYADKANKVFIEPGLDVPYNDTAWITNINAIVEATVAKILAEDPQKYSAESVEVEVTLTGADRDDSTYYLKYFPNFKKDLIEYDEKISRALSATIVRDIYFGGVFNDKPIDEVTTELLMKSFLPKSTNDFLERFKATEEYAALQREYKFITNYKKAWESAPYPPIFVTVDSVVIQSGHILLIERKAEPGKGLFALPGGFVNQKERLLDAAVRELREETKLKVPVPVIKGSQVKKEVFDLPDRSLRGRTITIAFLFKLAETGVLPEVKGGDDAKRAMWVPLSQVQNMREQLFEDHFHIIESMVGGTL
jgi:bifunctional NMN adenylyltransferase/nudix hydrolase